MACQWAAIPVSGVAALSFQCPPARCAGLRIAKPVHRPVCFQRYRSWALHRPGAAAHGLCLPGLPPRPAVESQVAGRTLRRAPRSGVLRPRPGPAQARRRPIAEPPRRTPKAAKVRYGSRSRPTRRHYRWPWQPRERWQPGSTKFETHWFACADYPGIQCSLGPNAALISHGGMIESGFKKALSCRNKVAISTSA